MADLIKTVKVLFQGEDEISPTLKDIAGSVDEFGAGVEAIADPFAKVADGVLALDAALVALAATGLALAFKASAAFETSSTSLSKILGDEVDQIGAVEAAVLELSNQYGKSATSVLDSTTDFKRAGFDVADSLTLVEQGIGLVIGAAEAELGVARATEIIIATLKGFNAPASEAARLTDVLNTVSNEYATSVVELGTGLSKLAPIAKLSGLSFEETAAVLTPVIEVFRSGDEAAIALKKGLLSLVSDQAPVRAALASIGVAQTDSNGALRAGKDILLDVAGAFKTLDENTKLFVASEIVGIQQAGRMVTVFDSLEKVTEITATAMGAYGSIQKEVDAVLATSTVAVERFVTAFSNLGIAVGSEFRAAAKGAIDGGTEIEIALQNIVGGDSFKPVFDAINEFSNDLGDLLSQIASDIPEAFESVDFTGLIRAISGVSDELVGVFDGVDLTTPEGLADAVQAAVDTLTGLANVTAGIVEAFGPTVDFIVDLIRSFNDLDSAAQKRFGSLIGASKIISDFGFKTAAAIVLIGDAAGALAQAFDVVIRTIEGLFFGALAIFDGVKLATIQVAQGILSVLEKISFGQFKQDIQDTQAVFKQWDEELQNSIVQGAADAEKSLTGMNVVFGRLAETSKGATQAISGDLEGVADALDAIPTEKDIEVAVLSNEEEFAEVTAAINAISDEIVVDITAEADISQATEELEFFDEAGNRYAITVPVETSGVQEVEDELAAIPTEKILEIKLQGDIDIQLAEITTAAETVQNAFEWTAQVDIAGVEAAADIAVAAFDGAASSVDALASATASEFGSLLSNWDQLSDVDQSAFSRQVEQQQEATDKALASQIELNTAQAEYLTTKAQAVSNGDAVIQIDGTGLSPALEMVMWEIIALVQVRANAESADFLLGLPT